MMVHCKNYSTGKTTNERFAKKASSSFSSKVSDTSDSMIVSHARESLVGSSRRSSFIEEEVEKYEKKARRNYRKKCCANCKSMATNRKITSQKELFELYTKHYRSTVTLNDVASQSSS
jgi:viroplasmin and RNaseH domain-containing protein